MRLERWSARQLRWFTLLLLLGCTGERAREAGAAAVDSAGEPAVVPGAGDTTSPTTSMAVPDSVLVRRGACPFECCVYREWQARSAIEVRTAPAVSADVAFTIAPGQRFMADNGEVRVTGVSRVVVRDTITTTMGEQMRFEPGDTIVLLDYRGEGTWNVWHEGRVREFVEQFWGMRGTEQKAEVLGEYAAEWWVHVTAPRAGWFLADTSVQFSGADACGA